MNLQATTPAVPWMQFQTFEEYKAAKIMMDEYVMSKGADLVHQACHDFFVNFPECEAVGVIGYTPYFNDGDECTFGIYDLGFKIPGHPQYHPEEWGDDDHPGGWVQWPFNWKNWWYHKDNPWEMYSAYSPQEEYPEYAEMSAAAEPIKDMLADEDIFLNVFGNHKHVTITPSGIEADDYDHE